MLLRPFQITDEVAVIDLWQRCHLIVPQNDPRRDIARKLAVQPELFLLAVDDEPLVDRPRGGRKILGTVILGTVMIGYEGHRGWINYLAVEPARRFQGIGRALMQAAEERLLALGCPKLNLQVRTTNRAVLDFYRALGYQIDDVVSFGKRLISDGP